MSDDFPAFPAPQDGEGFARGWTGMTLRDYFAAKAMASVLSNTEMLKTLPTGGNHEALISRMAYDMADAMLKERAK